ncbi:OLC1v1035636C1 [Oldenlandia corymbosa var. corymbosa]|uniref:OLC1v1035636C1 n=1 Tax=Oldenlandia corymbosa var. corymbosa TaxID=529605 RepID=A0AAV1CTI4_OLDCO|nr:OLC1v1035636C1 [Oldenlandia corymbosa var. corymbosa]
MSDATGFVQFLLAVAEIAKGAPAPSTLPVWKRELLNARDPPRVTYENIVPNYPKETIVQIVCVSLFFGPAEMAALKTFLPHHLKNKCTEFEVLTAFLWRCRAIALQPDQDREVKLVFFANGRPKFDPPLPKGYYGNVLAVPVAQTTARELMENPLGYAAELVMKAKSVVSEEYVRSTADMNVSRGRRRSITLEPRSMFLVSDLTRVGFAEVDFGWGNPVYYGVPIGDDKNEIHATSCNYSRTKNKQGEEGVLVPICLPKLAMKSFVQLMKKFIMMNIVWDDGDHNDEGDHVVIKFRKFRSLL